MCKAITTGELKKLLSSIVDKQDRFARELEGDQNPQAVAMRIKAQAEADIACSVLDAIRGNAVSLRILAE